MAEAALPILNMVILGSFMVGGIAQLNSLSEKAVRVDSDRD
ncbi:MAG: hypothetical protein V2I82_05910 [Halieaceae bacterium]|jgi:hypothetical protein|nr:hypothetical protein [Halieaceae bacterium]